jgi:hypothetical protein
VIFGDAGAEGTVFAGQTMLPLTTHCNDWPQSQEQYILKELLAYHLYNELTDRSLRVRLAHVSYEHTGRRPRVVERYAFFTEHFDALAKRNGMELVATERFDVLEGDPTELAVLDLYEFMIGNTDWSMVLAHNIAHFRAADDVLVAVPYDFDFSGVVNATYATPDPSLRIRRVTRRLYRGFCYPGLDWETVFRRFESARERVFAAIEQAPALDAGHRSEARAYVASFYELIGSEERRQDEIVEECRPLTDRS